MKTTIALAILAAVSAQANIIRNGSFETPTAGSEQPGGIVYGVVTTFRGGTTFDGWVVGRDSVDIVPSSLWVPPDGSQSLELNGLGPGFIYQDLNTTPGETYDLSFYLGVNGNWEFPRQAKLRVSFGSNFYDITQDSETDITFHLRTYSFVASSAVTRLQFTSQNEQLNYGAILDAITLDGPGSAIWPAVGDLPTYDPLVPGYDPRTPPNTTPPTIPDAGNALFLVGCGVFGLWSSKQILK